MTCGRCGHPTTEIFAWQSANPHIKLDVCDNCNLVMRNDAMIGTIPTVNCWHKPDCEKSVYRLVPWHHCGPECVKRNLSPTFSAESPVTADECVGQGGVPAASPSAPCSERLAVPTQPDPCAKAIQYGPDAICRTSPDLDKPPSPWGGVGARKG